jgi:hypothetical protein
MKELDNPRGLAFGDDGALYVAEAGSGGSGPCTTLRGARQGRGQIDVLHLELRDVRGERRDDGERRGHPDPAVRGRNALPQHLHGLLHPVTSPSVQRLDKSRCPRQSHNARRWRLAGRDDLPPLATSHA